MKEMTSKGVVIAPTSKTIECCMCGDYGLLYKLFQCSVCLFRSQHIYCSNVYPKAQSYKVCNWCLKKEETKTEETHSFSFSSYSSCNKGTNSNEDDEDNKIKNYTRPTSKLTLNSPIRKQRSQDRSLLRKKINYQTKESSLVMKKSKEIFKTKIEKQVFRVKVQRYKLLEEVCG